MKPGTRQILKYIISDYLTTNVGWFLFNIARFFTLPVLTGPSLGDFLLYPELVLEQILVPFLMVGIYAMFGAYSTSTAFYRSRLDDITNSFLGSLTGMLIIFFAVLINDVIPERLTNYELMLMLLACLLLPTLTARLCITIASARLIRKGNYRLRAVVVGESARTNPKLERIVKSSSHSGLEIVGCVDPHEAGASLLEQCRKYNPQTIIVMASPRGAGYTAEVLNELYSLDLPIFVTADLLNLLAVRPRTRSVVAEPLIEITTAAISPTARNLKRMGDIVISATALILLSPVLAAIALVVKLDSKGPVLYRQERIGYHKKPFTIYKFRTMATDAEADGPALSSPDDNRVTPAGRILRKYRLDELPQFWNVLKGDMSLVGPRPEREYYVRQILQRVPAYSLIHQVRPGITSWGMVRYGYASNVDEMIERLGYDLLYLENLSLVVDIKILFHTVSTVLGGKGM